MRLMHYFKSVAYTLSFGILLGPQGVAGVPEDLDAFFSKPAKEQQGIIWKEVEISAYDPMPEQDQAPPNNIGLLLRSENLVKVFQHHSVFMPPGREKATHQFGTVAKVEFQAMDAGRGYTGIFRSGACGILRLSLAKANPAAGGNMAYIPNLSFKVLRDGQPDTNILAMHSVEGLGGDANFFAHSFSNYPGPGISLQLRVFSHCLGSALGDFTGDRKNLDERARIMPLAESSFQEGDGSQVREPHAPYEIIFQPNPKFRDHFQARITTFPSCGGAESMRALDFRRMLGEPVFQDGEVLFDVYGRDMEAAQALWQQHWGGYLTQLKAWWNGKGFSYEENSSEPPPQSVHIGRMVLASRFIASRFGDQLPFRHPTIHEENETKKAHPTPCVAIESARVSSCPAHQK